MSVRVDFKTIKDNRKIISKNVSAGAKTAMTDVVDNLVKASSGSAPHDKGILEDAWSKEVGYDSTYRLFGKVSYSVTENGSGGGYNYAVKMHEGNYNLGEGSRRKSGGKGMSGRTYPVGKHFLSGVLEGERQAYTRHMEQGIKKTLR
ncbi:hypothetical protein MOD91_18165 [Bacillus haynesii]|uniref:hypothetical protein n=1 Tax=Bacillus haynesii TaxID=1925021 RepID=UPI00097BA3EF|nr:hypothetical protein [Bacillus haynesii]MCY8048450.1 hypothetical protein [Bacillus haynesii]MCY8668788.1 hypothetical protein [Bacillus haynesii]MCY9324073.1 hypothetical protein [Bacillus haynesii]OMI07716.1 hypothetical protein BVL54_20040 [Bacillus paralicheniformis]